MKANQPELGATEKPETKANFKALLQFDGGCRGNPGAMYGSYRVELDCCFEISENRFELGHGTNNEAEFKALIRALGALQRLATASHIQPQEIAVRVIMYKLACECLQLLQPFHSFSGEWQGRDANVEAFGH